jgi:membrane protease YdiL (CAAX protease family)
MRSIEDRVRALSQRAEFFLVITISFGYFIATSLSVLLKGARRLELTAPGTLIGIATEILILLVVGWILRVRGRQLTQLTGRPTAPSILAGFPLFFGYYCLYGVASLTIATLFPKLMNFPAVRVVPSAPALLLLAMIVLNSLFEELLVTGYVVTALSDQGAALAITASTLLRFLYHLYQGPIAAFSILPLGLLFAAVFWKWRDLWPLMTAHTLANVIALLLYSRS